MLLAFLNKLLFDEMYHFALQASPGSWGQLARLGFNEESGEDRFSEFLQAGEALLEEGEHRRAASQVPPATAWRIRKYSFKRAEPSPPAAGISGVPPGALFRQGSFPVLSGLPILGRLRPFRAVSSRSCTRIERWSGCSCSSGRELRTSAPWLSP